MRSKILRNRVAHEAALLLYTSQEKEYKQAKKRAAENLGTRSLPTNSEVADELDRIANEREGKQRKEQLLKMRKDAKKLMSALKKFNPRLVGSVWRGTAHKNSDIDIIVFAQGATRVLNQLEKNNFQIENWKWCSVTKKGSKKSSFHIYVHLNSEYNAEIVVRSLDVVGQPERCETYGDAKTGLNLTQLTEVLEKNPSQKFVPI